MSDASQYAKDIKSALRDKEGRTLHEQRWLLALRFLEGNQHLRYDSTRGDWIRHVEDGEDAVTVNMILPMYRSVMSRLSTAYPGTAVLPASPSIEDVTKAQTSEAALRYYWQRQRMDDVFAELVGWLLATGNGALHTIFDGENVATSAVAPFDLFYESGLGRIGDAQWVAVRTYVSRDEAKELYPDYADDIELYGTKSNASIQGVVIDPDSCPPGTVDIYDVYEKYTGRHLQVMGDKTLYEGETPGHCCPVQHVRYSPLPYRLWGEGLVGPLVELQRLYNLFRQQVMTNVQLMSNPKWLIPKNAGIAPNEIGNQPGEKVFYNPAGGVPQQLPAAPLPNHVTDNIQRIQAEMGDVAGLHSTALGKRAVGVSSGKAIEALTEQGLSALQVTQREIESAAERCAKCVLLYMREYYSEGKMMRMLDGTGRVVWQQLSQSDIDEDPEIFIEAGSMFQANALDREARAMQMFQAGLLTKDEALQQIDSRTAGGRVLQGARDSAHAKDVLDAILGGAAVELFASDNLPVFAEVFGDYMRSYDYYRQPPERQEYLRDVFAALSDALADPSKIDPSQPIFPQATEAEGLVAAGSPVAQGQLAAATLNAAQEEGILRAVTEGGGTENRSALAEARMQDTVLAEGNNIEGGV